MHLDGEWADVELINGKRYTCGYCGTNTSGDGGYILQRTRIDRLHAEEAAWVIICTSCNQPTYINPEEDIQVPSPKIVDKVEYLPDSLNSLFNETREAISAGLYNSSVLLCRKMLMNLAVLEGAQENKSFLSYVNYFEDNGFITVKMKPWVDKIRTIGNTATHEIPDIKKADALIAFEFLVMLLKLIYEFPSKMQL
ncbi:DUF4145 domain-containing protein [Rossellomorea vietnamensis]|uniref:DUF4145 domain-containing protein n=1 Tax=Rossellomorea vietnamensis TaxID=218284 RepID=UPI003CED9EE7